MRLHVKSIFLSLALAFSQAAHAGPAPFVARVVSVTDGDTLRVVDASARQVIIRLACIDAPERQQGEPAEGSRLALASMALHRTVRVRPLRTDRYRRTIAEVFVDEENLNLRMVQMGRAFVYREYLRGCDKSLYLKAESEAGEQKLGVWGDSSLLRPWVFRRNARERK